MENYHGIIANGGIVCYNYSADKLSYFKSGGKIDILLCPSTLKDFNTNSLPHNYTVLGACTNTLISDNGVRGEVISTRLLKGIERRGDSLYVLGGESITKACAFARNNSLSGLEELNGIPGSVGGAVVMNAGCFGREIAELIEYIDVFIDGAIERLMPSKLNFSYRFSALKGKQNAIVVGVQVKLVKGAKSDISDRMRSVIQKRKAHQPIEPSLGSVFRAVDGVPAGKIIDECGFKGMTRGGACVSPRHANFIINMDKATSADYIALVEAIKSGVQTKKAIELKREVIYLNDDGLLSIE